jgi:cobalt/nickel transport system permease protein
VKRGFIERTLAGLIATSEYAASAERLAGAGGVLQRIDPRVKVAGLIGLVIAVAASRNLRVIGGIFGIALVLGLSSKIRLARLAGWVWTPVLFFTGLIALPALFITPGQSAFSIGPLIVTEQGMRSAGFLISRAETAATLSALLVLTTPWPWIMKALRTFRFPVVLVAILGMTYRYIFVMLQTAFEMLESRKSRTVGILPPRDRRRLAASTAGVLLSKSIHLSGDVHLAMQSRGFRGEVYVIDDFHAASRDWLWLAGFLALAVAGIWLGK